MTEPLSTTPATATTRRRWILPVAAIALLAVGASIGIAIAANRDNNSSTPASNGIQVANVNLACSNWMMSTPTTATSSTENWCADMTSWMNQQITSGQTNGTMMWADPDRMLASCRSWHATNNTTNKPSTWCEDMVTWMRQHSNGDWSGSMMNGSMMGR